MNIKKILTKAGYTLENTGGNCTALVKHIDSNSYYMFTAETGHTQPYEYPVLAGYYIDDALNFSIIIPSEKALKRFTDDV